MLVSEYLAFVGRLRELGTAPSAARAIDEAVAATGLEPVYHRPIGELSKGFRQRVGLAAAILHRPDLLVLDEPTEGLDPNQRVEIRRLIVELGRERTVILSTHVLPGGPAHLCSRLLIINRGRLVADGPVDELVTRAKDGAHVDGRGGRGRHRGATRGPAGRRPDRAAMTRAGGRVRASLTVSGAADLRPASSSWPRPRAGPSTSCTRRPAAWRICSASSRPREAGHEPASGPSPGAS